MSGIEEAKRRIKRCLENQETELDLSYLDLTDLDKDIPELKYCLHLEKLYLGRGSKVQASLNNNRIKSISLLTALTNLKCLELANNRIFDLAVLAKFINLTELDLSNTYILDLTPLTDLYNLTKLNLWQNQIKDISPLAGLTKLTDLGLSKNQIKDISPLKGLSNLTKLDLWHNQIRQLSPLIGLRDLTELWLSENQIKDLSPLAGLTKLTELILSKNEIEDISTLASLRYLSYLDLDDNKVSDISDLKDMRNLNCLKLNNNQIRDISPLSVLISLNYLDVNQNKINDLTPLKGVFNLLKLELIDNQVRDISPLEGLTDLTELWISENPIQNFKPLLQIQSYRKGVLRVMLDGDLIPISLNLAVEKGYDTLKTYYDTLEIEGSIPNDQLKVILLGNSTAGKTSLVNYWGNKDFKEKQTTTHGIYTPMELPLKYESEEGSFRVNVWDFGGQDYYHATHRLFVTRDSTYILVCNQSLENKPEQELTTEFVKDGDETKEIQVKVQHYPYRYWLQTLTFLTKSGKIDDAKNQDLDKTKLPKLFLVENKCGTYEHKQYMRLHNELSSTLPFEVINQDFFQLDIKEAWRYSNLNENDRKARKFNDNYEAFEEKLIEVLQAQIKENRYEVHKNYPVIRDILASMAEYQQNTVVSNELNQILIDSKIAPLESYEKLPVWITYAQYEDLVRKNSLSAEPHFESLHIYLQNLCGRIFHFKDIPALADIVFIDPNWLHQTIYKVLSQEVLDNQGEFNLEDADAVIDGNILDAATFMEAMMTFDLVFEIPQQSPRRFIAPQYLPNDCPLSEPQLKKYQEVFHELSLTLEFPYYLPPSLISRIITQKGHLIKAGQEPLWRNGLIYTENGISIFVFCQPSERKIEIYLGKNTPKKQKERVLREFMQLLENRFSDDIEEVLISLPNETGKAKWKDLYHAKKEKISGVRNYESKPMSYNLDSRKYDFLFEQFENKPVNIFVCYAHDDYDEMVKFVEPLKREMASFATQHQIKINPFTDQQLTPGMRWDDILKAKIKENDILICLLSPSFFTSGYIQQNEYGQIMGEIAAGERDSLITPIYLKSCYVSESNPIANLQFFKPLSTNFVKDNITNFSFNNLLGQSDDKLIDNYVLKFVESIKSNILEIWDKK